MATIQAFAAALATDALVSGFDLMHMPEVFRELVGQYPLQRDLGFLDEMGNSEEVMQTTFQWSEENRLNAPFTIAAKSTVVGPAKTVRLTLSAEDHYSSGLYSNVRVNDRVEFRNGAKGLVIAKSEAVASAHTIDVQQVNTDYDVVAGAVVGQKVGIFSNGFGEGKAGYSQSILPLVTNFSAKVQIFRETFKITTTEIGNKTWVSFTWPTGYPNAGQKGGFYFIKAEGDTYDRFMFRRELGLLTNDENNAALQIDGTEIRQTRGFIPHVKRYGELMDYAMKPTMGTFETFQRLLNKNFQEKDVMGIMGLDFSLGLTSFGTDLMKNGGVLYNSASGEKMDKLALGFNSYNFASGYNFHMKPMQALASADTTGLAGTVYPGLCIICPTKKKKAIINGAAKQMAPFTVRWKKPVGGGAQDAGVNGRYKMWYTGGGADVPTDDTLTKQLNIASEEGAMILGAKTFIYCSKTA
jgi:hypothetical protein